MAIVYFAPDFESMDTLPMGFFIAVMVYVITHAVLSTTMFVAMMAFFAQVADPAIGGTYMTLLNTIANLGVKWPNQVVLFVVDWVTVKGCVGSTSGFEVSECWYLGSTVPNNNLFRKCRTYVCVCGAISTVTHTHTQIKT
jgi:hypothetical protein